MNVYYKILFGRPPAPTSYLASVGALPNDKNRNGSGGGAPENAVTEPSEVAGARKT